MATKKLITLAVLASTLTLPSAFARDGRGDKRNEFQVCKPYVLTKVSLERQLHNFEDEVLRPLQNRLDDQRRRVSQRISEENKIENVITQTSRDITASERRLNSIPGLIIANNNSIKGSQAKIPIIQNEIKDLEKELEDAGFFRRQKLKIQIKARKNDIEDERRNIQRKTGENANMESERNSLPARISNLRGRLAQAQENLAAHRNQIPSLNQLRDEEISLRNQLDSQAELRANMKRDLGIASIEVDRCMDIKQDALTYRELMKMAARLRQAECDVELVRNRLPYNISEIERRAFIQAAKLVCDPITDDGNGNL